jgi:hypothetical protein
MLWKGIARYAESSGARYLIGCSSLTSQDENEGVALYKELREKYLADLSQLRAFFGFFVIIFVVKACVFIGALPGNGRVETKCLPFGNGLLAVCRWHVSA